MALHTSTDADEIKALLTAALAADPVVNTICSSVLTGLDREQAAGWAAHPDGRPLQLAARSQAHTPVAVLAAWTDVSGLVDALAALDPPVQALAASPDVMAVLLAGLDRTPTERMDERLFRLDELIEPTGVGGAARLASAGDLDLLGDWYEAFAREAFGRPPPGGGRELAARSLPQARCWLWEDSGARVSMAVRHPVFGGASRIGPVYTPPAHRGHGYGSSVTAAATRDILDDGAIACLFTDLANPTSNKIYQALGYRPVLDRCAVRFG